MLAILLASYSAYSGTGFTGSLETPPSIIAPYPDEAIKPVISLAYDNPPQLRMILRGRPDVIRSDFKNKTITIGATYYKKGRYVYEYVPRTAYGPDFLDYRIKVGVKRRQSEFRSKALQKRERDKARGIFDLRIPIKSRTMESLFGEGGAGIKVTGYHRINFSGRSSWRDQASTGVNRQSKFPSLNMEQESRFDISGTIGSKISVSVSHDSKTDIPLANRIMLRYKGDEDDIIKTIEAGNTTLSLPNTQFVGYSSRIQGLFGIKTTAQIGALELTAIASQEKGTTERTSIAAGAVADKEHVRDYQYLDSRIFDLGRVPGIPGIEYDEYDFQPGDSIIDAKFFIYGENSSDVMDGAVLAEFYVDPLTEDDNAERTPVYVVEMESDYFIQTTQFWVLFDQQGGGSQREIGAFIIVKRNNGEIETIGNITPAEGEPYILKQIRGKDNASTSPTWNYMWRNVYSLGGPNVDLEGLEVKILKGEAGTEGFADNEDNQNGTKYIEILGLDQTDNNNQPKPDGIIDLYSNVIDPYRGLLIFPDRFPFHPATGYGSVELADPVDDSIYTHPFNEDTRALSKYYIEISNKSRAAEVRLGKANIIEGSERIVLNGRELQKGTDYSINYDFGQVKFLSDEALDPNADLDIEFEYSPFITAEKKTLFGIRGEYTVSNNLKFGSTFLYKSDKATPRKPKIGQETTKNIVWDADLSFKTDFNLFTTLANALPFHSTDVESKLAFSGEFAQSIPNPNVDGVAYIDDFEGARDAYSLGVYRNNWRIASRPQSLDSVNRRAKMIWYNPYKQVPTQEIWQREVSAPESGTHTLWLEYDPTDKDYRVNDANEDTTVNVGDFPAMSWAGIMRSLSLGAIDQSEANLLEVRLNGTRGILHIEFGKISEDVNGNGIPDTEDKGTTGNRILDEGEDVGLDGIPDELETNELGGYDSETNPDPHGDNWYYNGYGEGCNGCDENDYSHINGTEGNYEDPGTWGRPDTEDISNGGKEVSLANDYFSYTIDLSSNRFEVEGSELNGWRTYRIPIRDEEAVDYEAGTGNWQLIEFVRLWIESPDGQPVFLKIASMDLIKSNWDGYVIYEDSLTSTTAFSVAVINNQENTSIYESPPGVEGYYDQQTQTREPEQSLLIHFDSLTAGDECLAERTLFEATNFMGYRELNLFVNTPTDSLPENSIIYSFRLGQDRENYYGFQDTLLPGDPAKKWIQNEVKMDFNELSGLKEYLLLSREDNPDLPMDTIDGNYRVFGEPNLTRVKYLALAVENINDNERPTGDIWFDELRLTSVRKDVGVAFRGSLSGNFADLFTYSFSYSYKNPYFRGLSTSSRAGSQNNLGSGKSSTTYSISLNTGLERFLPKALGAKLPLSVRYSKVLDIPQLRSSSDIVLPKELQYDERTESISKGITLSESFNKKTKNPLFTLLLNKLRTSVSYSRTDGVSPIAPTSVNENYRINGQYSLSIPKVPNIRPFFWTQPVPMLRRLGGTKFYFFPNTYSFNANFNRSMRVSQTSAGVITSSLQRNFQGRMSFTYRITDNLSANYSMDTKRDLYDSDLIKFSFNPKKFKFGRETSYSQNISMSYTPTLFEFLTHKFNYSVSYRENLNLRDTTFNAGASKAYGVSGNLDFKELFSTKTKKRGGSRGGGVRGAKVVSGGDGDRVSIVKKMFSPIAKIMGPLTSWINPIAYDYNQRYSYTFANLAERADWNFRLGLTEASGARIKTGTSSTTQTHAVSRNTGYSLRSGTQLFGGLKLDVSFSRKIDQDIVKPISPSKNVSTTFPDIRFTIRPFKKFKMFNALIKKFQPRTGYSRSMTERYSLVTGYKESQSVTTSQRPLLSISFNIIRGMQINVGTDRSSTESKSFDRGSTNVKTRNRTVTRSTRISTKYSFSAPTGIKFPIFGRLKFRSTMSVSVDVSMSNSTTENATYSDTYEKPDEKTDLTITPTISYSFSSQIKGGISGRWQDSKSLNVPSHTRELRIFVDIRF